MVLFASKALPLPRTGRGTRLAPRLLFVALGALLIVLTTGPQPVSMAQPPRQGSSTEAEDEAWTEFVNALRDYEAAPKDEAALEAIKLGEQWLRNPTRDPKRRLDTLRVVLEVCRRHGEDERIVLLTTRFLREMRGELQIWLLEEKAGALVRLGRDEEAAGLISQLRAIQDSRRRRAAAQRAIYAIERQQRLRPGETPPAFSLPSLDGDAEERVSLEDLTGQRCVLVFWESWHPASRMLLRTELVRWPQPEANDADSANAPVPRLVLLSRESSETQRAFRDVHEYPWLFLCDEDGAAFEAYRVRGLPFLVELDAEGKVVRVGSGIAEVIRAGFEAEQEDDAGENESQDGEAGEQEED